jgi:hypothetical protein
MRILVGLITVCLTTSAFAEPDPDDDDAPAGTQYEIGARVAVMPASWVGGTFANGRAGGVSSGLGTSVKLYGDVRVADHVHIGAAIPVMIDGVGPTSSGKLTETDVGLAPRVVFDAELTSVTGGYLAFEPAVVVSKLPGGEWWTGYQASLTAGVRVALSRSINLIGEVVVQPTAVSGTVNFPLPTDAPMQGTVKTVYFGGGAGLETHF